jgi:hypothetical protein
MQRLGMTRRCGKDLAIDLLRFDKTASRVETLSTLKKGLDLI